MLFLPILVARCLNCLVRSKLIIEYTQNTDKLHSFKVFARNSSEDANHFCSRNIREKFPSLKKIVTKLSFEEGMCMFYLQ